MPPKKKSESSNGIPDRTEVSKLGEYRKEDEGIDYLALIPLLAALVANIIVLMNFM